MKTIVTVTALIVATLLVANYLTAHGEAPVAISLGLFTLICALAAVAPANTEAGRKPVTRVRAQNIAFLLCMSTLWLAFASRPAVYRVTGNSMAPAIHNGDVIVGAPVRRIDRGDVIVYHRDGRDNVARVLGMPLDAVTFANGNVYINGQVAVENYLEHSDETLLEPVPTAVPIQHYFVLADRRHSGIDSRRIGPIPVDQVKSQARHIYRLSEASVGDRAAVAMGLTVFLLLAGAAAALYRWTSRRKLFKALLMLHSAMVLVGLFSLMLAGGNGVAFGLSFYYGLKTIVGAAVTTYGWLSVAVAILAYAYIRGLPPAPWRWLGSVSGPGAVRRLDPAPSTGRFDVASGFVQDVAREYRYWGFISYSSKDKHWARWLHKAIERWGVPARLIGHQTPAGEPAPKHFSPLFYDRAELPASATLAEPIEDALRASRYLIVVCSPNAARSRWVNKEVETYRNLGGSQHLLAVIVDGEPNAGNDRECFPPALLQVDPIAADARPEGDGKPDALLKLLAGMLGVGFDTLKRRETHRRFRRLQFVAGVTAVLLFVFAGLALYSDRQRDAAVRARDQAENILQYLLYDLDEQLAPLGRLDIVNNVQRMVDAYYRDLGVDGSDPAALGNRLMAHSNAGDRLLQQGNLQEALREYEASLTIADRLVTIQPQQVRWHQLLALSYQRMAAVRRRQGDLSGALAAAQAVVATTEQLVLFDSTRADWQHSLFVGYLQTGEICKALGDLDGALAAFQLGVPIIERLAAIDPQNVRWQGGVVGVAHQIGEVARARGDPTGAIAAHEAGLAVAEDLTARHPEDSRLQHLLAQSYEWIGPVLVASGDLTRALAAYEAGLALSARLATADPSNADWQMGLAGMHRGMGDVRKVQGDLPGALAAHEMALRIFERVVAGDHSARLAQGQGLAVTYAKIGEVKKAQGDLPGALRAHQAAAAVAQRLAAVDQQDIMWQWLLSNSNQQIGDIRMEQGDFAGALAAYEASLETAERLAASDSGNADWQRTLWTGYWRVASVRESTGDTAATASWRKAFAVLSGMQTRGLFLLAEDEQSLEQLRQKVQ